MVGSTGDLNRTPNTQSVRIYNTHVSRRITSLTLSFEKNGSKETNDEFTAFCLSLTIVMRFYYCVLTKCLAVPGTWQLRRSLLKRNFPKGRHQNGRLPWMRSLPLQARTPVFIIVRLYRVRSTIRMRIGLARNGAVVECSRKYTDITWVGTRTALCKDEPVPSRRHHRNVTRIDGLTKC